MAYSPSLFCPERIRRAEGGIPIIPSGFVARIKSRLFSTLIRASLRRPVHLCLVALACCLISGCATTEKPAYIASVEIQGNTPGQITAMAEKVFADNGYRPAEHLAGKLWFEKPGSGMNKFAYGDWVGDTQVWIRVKLNIAAIGEALYRLECTPVLVKDKGGSTEEEIKISSVHHRPYQKLLDEVAARLKPKAFGS